MLAQGQYFNPLTSVYLFPRGESFDAVKSFEVFDVARNVYLRELELWRWPKDAEPLLGCQSYGEDDKA